MVLDMQKFKLQSNKVIFFIVNDYIGNLYKFFLILKFSDNNNNCFIFLFVHSESNN